MQLPILLYTCVIVLIGRMILHGINSACLLNVVSTPGGVIHVSGQCRAAKCMCIFHCGSAIVLPSSSRTSEAVSSDLSMNMIANG